MAFGRWKKELLILTLTLLFVGLLAIFSAGDSSATVAQNSDAYVGHIRTIEAKETGILNPAGLAFSPGADSFFVMEAGGSEIVRLASYGVQLGSERLPAAIADPANMVYDSLGQRLLIFDGATGELIELMASSDDSLDASSLRRHDLSHLGLKNSRGMTVDPARGHLYFLDESGSQIVKIEPQSDGGFMGASTSEMAVPAGMAGLRGLAFDPSSGHLHLLDPAGQTLYELSNTGQLLATRDLSAFNLRNPRAIVFAPSGDSTDDPALTNLYIADGAQQAGEGQAGSIVELSFRQPPEALGTIFVASLIQTIDTSAWVPPSPDPTGIEWLPHRDTFMVSDAEVDEMPIFTGDNVFETDITGTLTLSETLTTIPWSDEPSGLTLNPDNNHLFVGDDLSPLRVYEWDPGPDGVYDSADDVITWFSTLDFESHDPEGVTYDTDNGVLFIADGQDNQIYRVDPGTNGIFDGIPPTGDDEVTNFDVGGFGFTQLEGIVYDPVNGYLYIVGLPKTLIAHVSTDGVLVRLIDISAANPKTPSGLSFGPSSVNPAETSLWISDRAVDNNTDPNENDGKIYEMSIPPITTGNLPPQMDAGPNQTITFPDPAVLDGTLVSDDGIPAAATTEWTQAGGPGIVTFADPSAIDTTATFSMEGVYTLRLTGDDTELSGQDEVTITVNGDAGVTVLDIPIIGTDPTVPSRSSDDAEEVDNPTNSLTLFSPDLDMMYDQNTGDTNLLVGMRFVTVTIPSTATVSAAYVQFTVDAVDYSDTSLTVRGQDADNPGTFSFGNKISTRITTTAESNWTPPIWPTVGLATPYQRTPDISSIIQEIVDRPGWASGNALVIMVEGDGERAAAAHERDPAKAPVLHVEYWVNTPPVVNAGLDQTVTYPDPASLDGTVTDDGNSGPLTNVWSKTSGPGTVTFGDPNAVDTTATFSQSGTYVLRLTADDGEHIRFDEVTIISNGPPTADAGADQTTTLPSPANLNGTVTDDGLPGPVTSTWSKISGPGTVTFGNANAEDTTATFSQGGIYVLRLTADDGDASDFDEVTITANVAPVVNAGVDQEISPPDPVVLAGTATDDGLPGGPLTTTWSKVSGPGTVIFANASAVNTTATLSLPGTYVLRLTAFDGAATTSDDVTIVYGSSGIFLPIVAK